jgi:hypothetical protein
VFGEMEFQALRSLALKVGEARSAEVVLSRIVSGLAAQENVALARLWLARQAISATRAGYATGALIEHAACI